jgi:dUTPase
MPDYYYRLELLPTAEGAAYYTNVENRPIDNAGVDLFICQDYNATTMAANESATLLDLGTAARMIRQYPDGHQEECHFSLFPRSSIMKTGMIMANSQGVIDSSYRGTIKAPVWVVAPKPFMNTFKDGGFKGARYFQIVAPDMAHIDEVRIVTSLPVTPRGHGAFGSTGTYTLPQRVAPQNSAPEPSTVQVVPPPGFVGVPVPGSLSTNMISAPPPGAPVISEHLLLPTQKPEVIVSLP